MAENQLQPFNSEGTGLAKRPVTALAEAAASREASEVQAAMIIAKRFPRNIIDAENKILDACKRIRMAEVAMYAYPRGSTKVEGPSIRLAEAMAQAWGNIDFGIKELEQRDGESVVMAYAWDLETNARHTKVFTVKHERTKNEGYGENRVKVKTKLDDPRDIYEMVANQGARRLRACILDIIPGDIQEAAIEQCRKTLAGDSTEPVIDRVKKIVRAFQTFGVTEEIIEERLGHKLKATDANELVTLRNIYQSLTDGMSKREDWFNIAPEDTGKTVDPDRLTPGKKKGSASKKSAKDEKPAEQAEPAAKEEAEPDVRQQADKFFGQDLDDHKPVTDGELTKIAQILDLKLSEAGREVGDRNRKLVMGFACIGKELDLTDVSKLTMGDAKVVLQCVKAMTPADVNEALEA